MTQRFLVTGGAGYVGSHLVMTLVERGDSVVVIDNLRTGHRGAVPDGAQLAAIDLADSSAVDALLSEGPWDAVFHFASLTQVGESMRLPFRYLIDNGANGMRLIEACVRHGVSRFVLSSTCAVYGTPDTVPIPEDAPQNPESPYGEGKRIIERALYWADRIHGLRFAALRYFNAAGADPGGRIGEDHRPETHLVPLVIDAALGRRPELDVYGNDYPTPDGTCVRDYIHVNDLADAHIRAVDRIEHGSISLNLGTGIGHSVLEVIQSVQRASGRPVPYRMCPRRPGDPASLIAAAQHAQQELAWRPRFADLDEIVRTALLWREAHPNGYGD
ncbi:MAG TPA: UDP-glucose 4-epimerase GalE [Acetobacteraceae bacterium]|jgi:UDP-glucose 4-epimerase|nr:UDP-glucose 4-epimerase GalE [Acetobacteraceae bacterium]